MSFISLKKPELEEYKITTKPSEFLVQFMSQHHYIIYLGILRTVLSSHLTLAYLDKLLARKRAIK